MFANPYFGAYFADGYFSPGPGGPGGSGGSGQPPRILPDASRTTSLPTATSGGGGSQ